MKKYLIGFAAGVVFALAVNVGLALWYGEHVTGNTVTSPRGASTVEYGTVHDISGKITEYTFEYSGRDPSAWQWRLNFNAERGGEGELTPENITKFVHVTDEGFVSVSFDGIILQSAVKK